MKGETLTWMMLADRLKKLPGEVKRGISSSDFVLWKVYLENEVNFFHREDHYFAAIITMLHNMFAEKKDRIELKDALFKFDFQRPEPEPVVVEDEEEIFEGNAVAFQEAVASSKSFWFAFCGLGPDGLPLPGQQIKRADPPPPPKKLKESPNGTDANPG